MGRKPTIFLLSIFIIGATFAPFIHAEEKTYWTHEEMVELEKEVAEEIFSDPSCKETDHWCIRRLYLSMKYRGGQYAALPNYGTHPLTITSFNPSKGTISVFFQDEFLRDRINGLSEKDYIKDLFIARFDKGKEDRNYFEKILSGEELLEGTRLAVLETESKNGENWLAPNQEVTFKMIDSEFNDNISNYFVFYFSTSRARWMDPANFDSCMESPDYREGMECRIVYAERSVEYIPMEVVPEPTEVPSKGETELLPEPTMLAPDTSAPINDKNRVVEMPWWITALIISGGILLVWWFMPTRLTKFQKKSKKSVDKSKPV